MFIKDGIAYAAAPMKEIRVLSVKPLDDKMMIPTFASGEKRLYDATPLLDYPAFQPLKDDNVFKNAKVEHGVVAWLDGETDIAPETTYHDSCAYDEMPA